MKTTLFRLILAALCLGAGATLSSCTSPIEGRITKNPQLFERLSDNDRMLVTHGQIREGMTKEGVFLALGRPDNVAFGRERGAQIERWTYADSYPVQTTTIGLGWGSSGFYGGGGLGYGYSGLWDPYWRGYGYGYGGPGVAYMPYQSDLVEFRNGRVIKYLQQPR